MISMIYIIGFLVTFLVELLIEHLYYGNGLSGTVTIKDIMEDLGVAMLSWLGLVLVAIWFWGEWYTRFPMKGYGQYLYDYEERLKSEEDKNRKKKSFCCSGKNV
jgi:hypothetical protein